MDLTEQTIDVDGSKAYLLKDPLKKGENFNFHDYTLPAVANHLVIEGTWKEQFKVFASKDIRGLSIVSEGAEVDLSFLSEHFPATEVLYIQADTVSNTDRLTDLKKLIYISLTLRKNQSIRWNLPDSLKCFAATWRDKYRIESMPPSLEYILLDKAKSFDFKNLLPELQSLVKLDLQDCVVGGGDEFLKLPKLRYLALTKCSDVKMSRISNHSIKYVNLSKVEMRDWSWLEGLKEVDILILEDCGTMPSLKGLAATPSLRGLWLAGKTKIDDGDFGFLSRLPRLQNLFIRDYPHYSHKSLVPWSWKRFQGQTTGEILFKQK